MTLAEASVLLGVGADYLRVAANRGSLKAIKMGRDWLVDSAEVERYAAENAGKPGRPKGSKNKPKP